MNETTVWACKGCGRCNAGPSSETCGRCGGTMAQLAESDALRRFMEHCEPPTGWPDDDALRREWRRQSSPTASVLAVLETALDDVKRIGEQTDEDPDLIHVNLHAHNAERFLEPSVLQVVALANALQVVARTPHIAEYLQATDPKALAQVRGALSAAGLDVPDPPAPPRRDVVLHLLSTEDPRDGVQVSVHFDEAERTEAVRALLQEHVDDEAELESVDLDDATEMAAVLRDQHDVTVTLDDIVVSASEVVTKLLALTTRTAVRA
jgi:hypothetical protein